MKWLALGILLTGLFGILACAGCDTLLGADREFAMTLDGNPYLAQFDPPTGTLLEMESGMNLAYQVRITFPLTGPGNVNKPGLDIEFEPTNIRAGEEITFGAQATNRILISFYPVFGHNYAEGQLLIFGPSAEDGGSIIFEKFEARIGGQVKGILKHATLHGYYETGDILNPVTPTAPMKMELHNFPFDVILEEAWW